MSTPESTPTHVPRATRCQSRPSPYARVDFISPVRDIGFGLWFDSLPGGDTNKTCLGGLRRRRILFRELADYSGPVQCTLFNALCTYLWSSLIFLGVFLKKHKTRYISASHCRIANSLPGFPASSSILKNLVAGP